MPDWAEVGVRTAPSLLRHAVERRGDGIAALTASAGRDDRLFKLGYAELLERAQRVAAGLRELGTEPGDRVALLVDNRWFLEAVTTYHASHLVGAVNVALNGRWVVRELAAGLRLVRPRVIVCGEPWYELCRAAVELEGGDAPRLIAVGTGSLDPSGDPVDFDWLGRRSPLSEPYPVTENDDADWVFTSGTTGDLKAVRFTHGQTVATGMQVAEGWGLTGEDLYQSPSPYYTSTGCRTNLLGALAARCTYLPEPVTDLTRILKLACRYRPSVYFGVSSMFRLLLDKKRDQLDSLKSLRRLVYGGMVMPESFHRQLDTVFVDEQGTEVMHLMGLTEGGPTGVYVHPDDHRRKAGAVGDRGFSSWTELAVDTDEDGVGELHVRGPSVTTAVATADAPDADPLQDGWLPTGDVVSVDADGFLFFVDRKRDVIRRGGLNIASGEVEAVFKQHKGVAEVAVVAKPHRVLGEDLCAFVVSASAEVDLGALRVFCAERLSDYKVPRDIRLVADLPTNAMGRVRKGKLRETLTNDESRKG